MTEQQTVDLVAWLTAIWDEEERIGKSADWGVRSGSELRVQTISSPGIAPGVCASPQHVLARIAADRKILELHSPVTEGEILCATCATRIVAAELAADPWPCPTVRLLASPYKGREGWQEEWE
jgi:hypothetical protein